MSIAEVMAVVRRDARYYAASGGGITLSGGEPTAQFEFCLAILAAAKAVDIHTCLDTCGLVSWSRLDVLRRFVDVFLFDYKATDPERHLALTGVAPGLPHGNLIHLLECGENVRLRCPLIPRVNDTEAHLAAIAGFGRRHPRLPIDVLPYHETGASKYSDLGRDGPDLGSHVPMPDETAAWLAAIHANGAPQAVLAS
jgi:pyruvate formate lyase activating enzyme